MRAKLGDKVDRGRADGAAGDLVERVFDALEAGIDFDSWPWKLDRFALRASGLDADGLGSFDPETGRVDLRLTARLDAGRTARLVAEHSRLRLLVDDGGRLALPLRLEGTLVGPSISVDLGDVLERKLAGQQQEAVKEELKDELGGLVRGLLDRDKKKKKAQQDPPPP